jgi:signal peptidase I
LQADVKYKNIFLLRIRQASQHIQIFLFAVVGALVLKMFVIDAVYVPSHSMEGTISAGDYVLVNKLICGAKPLRNVPFSHAEFSSFSLPRFSSIHRGDVIVFELPGQVTAQNDPIYFVKRCVAVGGDVVQIKDGILYVNQAILSIPINNNQIASSNTYNSIDQYGPVVVPKRAEIIRLTHANLSEWIDLIQLEGHQISRGVNSEILIDGQETKSYRVEKDYLFVLGDNRHNSYDSRYFGFVPEENVIGEAMMVYWSSQSSNSQNFFGLSNIRWNRIGKIIE